MGRIYQRAKKRAAKTPFLSSAFILIYLSWETSRLIFIYVITTGLGVDFQDTWCRSYNFQLPLLYMFMLVYGLMFLYFLADAYRILVEDGKLSFAYVAIFSLMFSFGIGQGYFLLYASDHYSVNNCQTHYEGWEPQHSYYLDQEMDSFLAEYQARLHPDSLTLCPHDERPMGRWCRQSRMPEKDFLRLGKEIFGPDWDPAVKQYRHGIEIGRWMAREIVECHYWKVKCRY